MLKKTLIAIFFVVSLTTTAEDAGSLSQLSDRVKNYTKFHFRDKKISPISGVDILRRAQEALGAHHYHLAAAFFERYLRAFNGSESPNALLTVRFGLGVSYQHIKNYPLAIANLKKYLSQFLSTDCKNFDQLLAVLRVILNIPKSEFRDREFFDLLEAISHADLPHAIKPEIIFVSAKIAAKIGLGEKGYGWLNQVSLEEDGHEFKASAYLNQGLIAISLGNIKSAETAFDRCLRNDHDLTQALKERCHLGRARIYAHLGLFALALKDYDQISKDHFLTRVAAFEKIYVYLKSSDHQRALALALEFVTQNQDENSAKIFDLIPYLKMKALSGEDTEKTIEEHVQKLLKLRTKLPHPIHAKKYSAFSMGLTLHELTKGELVQPASAYLSLETQNALLTLKTDLSDSENALARILKHLGSSNLSDIFPEYELHEKELRSFAIAALKEGSALLADDFARLSSLMNAEQKTRVTAAKNRRSSLLSLAGQASRTFRSEAGLQALLGLDEQLKQLETDLEKVTCDERSGLYQLEKTEAAEENKRPWYLLSEDRQNIEEEYFKLIRDRFTLKMKALEHTIEHSASKELILSFMMAIDDEARVYSEIRDKKKALLETGLDQKARNSWQSWRLSVENIQKAFLAKDKKISEFVATLNLELTKLSDELIKLKHEFKVLSKAINAPSPDASGEILATYLETLNRKLARLSSYVGDISLLKAQELENKRLLDLDYFSGEQARLGEQLYDLKSSPLWRWPNGR